MPNILPVRPNPQTTSSTISNTPYLSQIDRTMGQYSSPGTIDPIELVIGSPISAATVSGPSARIIRSTASAQSLAHSEGVVPPYSQR